MLIFIPKSIGQLTGWKAVGVLLLILGCSGVGVWSSLQPKSFGHGTWDIPPGKAYLFIFTAKSHARMKAEFTPQGATAATDAYTVWVLDEANKLKLDNPATDPQTVQKIIILEATGSRNIPLLSLDPGTYYIITENAGKTPLALQYDFSELHN